MRVCVCVCVIVFCLVLPPLNLSFVLYISTFNGATKETALAPKRIFFL